MQQITVFTPTYNRRDLLERVYESLTSQTDKDFIWMVIDDGSSDTTSEYIKSLICVSPFKIEYYYKENGGLHTGYNCAISNLKTELCMCCDSDDWLPFDCIEKVKNKWNNRAITDVAGIVGLDFDRDGKTIGLRLPEQETINLNKLYIHGKLIGDKKLVVRSELYKNLRPIETINGEKNFNPNYYNVIISENYDWLAMNENLCFVEYQESGMANNIYYQYLNSPNSFIEIRKLYLNLSEANLKFKFKHSIHLVSSCILAGKASKALSYSPCKFITALAIPFGWLLSKYIKYKTRV